MLTNSRRGWLLVFLILLINFLGAIPARAQSPSDPSGSNAETPRIPENQFAELLLKIVKDPCQQAKCDPCKMKCVEQNGIIDAVVTNSAFTLEQTDWNTRVQLGVGLSGVGNQLQAGNELQGALEIKVSSPKVDLTPFLTLSGDTTCDSLASPTQIWKADPSGIVDPKFHNLLKISELTAQLPLLSVNKTVAVTLTINADASARIFFVGGSAGSNLTRTLAFDVNASVPGITQTYEDKTVEHIQADLRALLTRKMNALIAAYWSALEDQIKAHTPNWNIQAGDMVYSGSDVLSDVALAVNANEALDGFWDGASSGQVRLQRPAYTAQQLGLTCQHAIE
jgi:hypothetical protein